ncbi:hypothetical protein LDENG_00209190, partial [Lucifuga dentata]
TYYTLFKISKQFLSRRAKYLNNNTKTKTHRRVVTVITSNNQCSGLICETPKRLKPHDTTDQDKKTTHKQTVTAINSLLI